MGPSLVDDLANISNGSSRKSKFSLSSRSQVSASGGEVFLGSGGGDIFQRSDRKDDEQQLLWAAIERLPTFDRVRKGILKQVLDNGRFVCHEVDVANLGLQDKKQIMEGILKIVEEDNDGFLQRLRDRTDRVGIDNPKIEVRCENVSIDGDAYVGSRALPTLLNVSINFLQSFLGKLMLFPSNKRELKILKDVSSIVKPSRMTLLLGPPSAGKTTLLKTLAGALDKNLRMSGKVTYSGHEFSEFIPRRTCSYISQHDLHNAEMTVRETMDFAGRCLGVGTRYDHLLELSRREKDAGIKPDSEIDVFMKAIALSGQESSLITDYVLKILSLDICADIFFGNEMLRGISGGQKKRLTIGEMLVGPAKVFFMDEISTGLDSSTTHQIVRYMRQMVHIMDMTMIMSLLQPAPETYDLFDDIILLSEGQIVYQGPCKHALEFFESAGFRCPERKGVADFLQEVTSIKDQEQYWYRKDVPYRYVSVTDFVYHFSSFHGGLKLFDELAIPYEKSKTHPAALVTEKYGISNMALLQVCLSREWLLTKRNWFLYVFKITQITIMSIITSTVFIRTQMKVGQLEDGGKFYGALFYGLLGVMLNGVAEFALTVFRLPVFYKQRDGLFYPAWVFALPIFIMKIPLSLMESLIWVGLTYYTIGFAPDPSRFFRQLLAYVALHHMALSLYRLVAAIGRTLAVSSSLSVFAMTIFLVLGGFVAAKADAPSWLKWCFYLSPVMYAQNALAMNEFLDKRWSTPNTVASFSEPTVGKVLLKSKGMFVDDYMYWICIIALFAFSFLFNICFIVALTYLDPFQDSKPLIVKEDNKQEENETTTPTYASNEHLAENESRKRGMVLPFQPLSLAFTHVNYYVDMPAEMKKQGIEDTHLHLLRDVSGAFRPGVLTALVGVSGAGKTTLLDVLAGRKTGGYIEGSISISGYPKKQTTFARVSGYCEQNDIHSPYITVHESLVYSASLRLAHDVDKQTRKMFVEEVMDLIELNPMRDALIGLPGVDGLSTEQRKRVTIAVELVANPSIIFMDEPTSGLDARAAAIVMRTVRNTVDTGRTVVCTIHQPSIHIFEAFDELLLMKTGGQVIYTGPLGRNSHLMIEYFQSIHGIPKIRDDYNPATWMLEISTPAVEAQLNVDLAEIYANSELYRRNQELIRELSKPTPGSSDIYFSNQYAQSFYSQCKACFWKQNLSYWRNPQYNVLRFLMTTILGIIFGIVYWKKGDKTGTQQDLFNLLGAMYVSIMFLGGTNTSTVLPVVSVERTVFYREKAAGMYSALPYAFAQVAIEIIYIAIQTMIYTLLLYSMIGFQWNAGKFFMFYYFLCMSFIYFTIYGMMLVSLTPNFHIAGITVTLFYNLWGLFNGFMIPRTQIPLWWRWYYWASPPAWTIYGIVTSQMGDETSPIFVLGLGDIPLKEYLKDLLGFEYDFLGVVIVVHLAWALLFCLVFAYAIKFLNFQRR